MSKVKRFHKKEAARRLVELQRQTEDERLMDYRRQLIDNNKPEREQQQACWPTASMDRQQQACWPWGPNYFSLPPYNTVPIGYPTWLSTPNWTSYMPDTATNPYMQGFSGMEYPTNLPWPITMLPHQQGKNFAFIKRLQTILQSSFCGSSIHLTLTNRYILITQQLLPR